MSKCRMLECPGTEEQIDSISTRCGVDKIIAKILIGRGLDTAEKAQLFLDQNHRLFHDPFLLPDMERAVVRLQQAIACGELILVVGDSDADGITATAIMMQYLRVRAANAEYTIPDNGNNLAVFSQQSLADMLERGVRLVVTVDLGVSAVEQISAFQAQGIDVIVTDHHECKKELPACFAVIDPKCPNSDYPFDGLSGAGVALKFVCAHASRYGDMRAAFYDSCDLAAVGTVADAMPLLDENRFIVSRGLDCINEHRRIAMGALLATAGYNPERKVTASSAGFVLAPRINAAGRINQAGLAVEMFLSKSYSRAKEIADVLAGANHERQKLESSALKEVSGLIDETVDIDRDKLILVRVEKWQTGIAGIVASRLVDRYGLPSVVVSFADGVGRGSGRSVEGFNLFHALEEDRDLLIEYGGHPLAAGFAVEQDKFDALAERLREKAQRAYEENAFQRHIMIESELDASSINLHFAQQLLRLEPYGSGNPQPVFMMEDVEIEEILSLANERHLRFNMRKDGKRFVGLRFGKTIWENKCTAGDRVSVAFAIDVSIYRGKNSLQLILKDIKLSPADEAVGYEDEYRAYEADPAYVLPAAATPSRQDVVDVYSYFLRTSHEAGAHHMYNPAVAARRVSRSYGRPVNFAQLMLSVEILSELNMIEYQKQGKYIYVRTKTSADKANLNKSALWRRVRG